MQRQFENLGRTRDLLLPRLLSAQVILSWGYLHDSQTTVGNYTDSVSLIGCAE
jgi:hypothetical protein